MSNIHFQCAEYCRRRKKEPDWEVRAGSLEEVRSCHWKGHPQFSRKREGLGLRWVGGRKHSREDSIWAAWNKDTGLAIVTVQLEARELMIKEVWRKGSLLLSLSPPLPPRSFL